LHMRVVSLILYAPLIPIREGFFCIDVDTICSSINICRNCNTFSAFGNQCIEIDEYHIIMLQLPIKDEIFTRGPLTAGINAKPLVDYKGGVYSNNNLLRLIKS